MIETITLRAADVSCEIVPARGALVTGLRVGDRDVLYLDRATLEDPTKNVRGGIPLLFPFAGKLLGGANDETFTLTGTTMKQHGFARNRAWTVTERETASLRMTLVADAETLAQWPYAFTAHHTAMVIPRGIQLELTIVAGDQALPVSPGWHPYFAIAPADKAKVGGDLVAAAAIGDRFGDDREFDFGVPAPIDGRSRFTTPSIALDASPELRHLQLWSQPGKPFICIEPFYGPAGTINTERRGWVPAGEARTFAIRIRSS